MAPFHRYFLAGILILAICPPVFPKIKDYGFWKNNIRKFVYAMKMYYAENLAYDAPRDKGYTLERPSDPWKLLGQSCSVADWQKYVKHFVVEGEDPEYYFDALKAYTSPLSTICLYADSTPVLGCMSATAGLTTGPGTCQCLHLSDLRHKYTPFTYVPDPTDSTRCMATEGAICEKGIIECENDDRYPCSEFSYACGEDSIIWVQSVVHSLGGNSREASLTPAELIIFSQKLANEDEVLTELLTVTQHAVITGENGCNVEMFDSVSLETEQLLQALGTDSHLKDANEMDSSKYVFDGKYTAFKTLDTSPTPMTGFDRSIKAYDVLEAKATATGPEERAAKLTKLCLDNYPATRCLKNGSPEAIFGATAPITSKEYLLNGQCVCSEDVDKKTPLFRHATIELPLEYTGKRSFQCAALPDSSCDSIAGPIPCASDDDTNYQCSPFGIKEDDYVNEIPYIYYPFKFWICQNLENQPEKAVLVKVPKSNTSVQRIGSLTLLICILVNSLTSNLFV